MKLVQLIYVSTLAPGVDVSELNSIREASARNNTANGVTGILVFGENYFLQQIEGGATAVNALFSKICRDKRHERVQILSYEEVSEREFEKWGMKVVLLTKEKLSSIFKFSSKPQFLPYELSSKNALALLKSLQGKE